MLRLHWVPNGQNDPVRGRFADHMIWSKLQLSTGWVFEVQDVPSLFLSGATGGAGGGACFFCLFFAILRLGRQEPIFHPGQ